MLFITLEIILSFSSSMSACPAFDIYGTVPFCERQTIKIQSVNQWF